MSNVDMIEYI